MNLLPGINLLPRRISFIGGYIDPAFERRIDAAKDLLLTSIDKTVPFADVRRTLAATHAIQIDFRPLRHSGSPAGRTIAAVALPRSPGRVGKRRGL